MLYTRKKSIMRTLRHTYLTHTNKTRPKTAKLSLDLFCITLSGLTWNYKGFVRSTSNKSPGHNKILLIIKLLNIKPKTLPNVQPTPALDHRQCEFVNNACFRGPVSGFVTLMQCCHIPKMKNHVWGVKRPKFINNKPYFEG